MNQIIIILDEIINGCGHKFLHYAYNSKPMQIVKMVNRLSTIITEWYSKTGPVELGKILI